MELKNESGSTGSDPYMQSGWQYAAYVWHIRSLVSDYQEEEEKEEAADEPRDKGVAAMEKEKQMAIYEAFLAAGAPMFLLCVQGIFRSPT